MRFTVDGQTLLDDDLGSWQQTPPERLRQMVTPGNNPQPWMKAALIAMVDAALLDKPTSIDVHTSPTGWTVRVQTFVAA